MGSRTPLHVLPKCLDEASFLFRQGVLGLENEQLVVVDRRASPPSKRTYSSSADKKDGGSEQGTKLSEESKLAAETEGLIHQLAAQRFEGSKDAHEVDYSSDSSSSVAPSPLSSPRKQAERPHQWFRSWGEGWKMNDSEMESKRRRNVEEMERLRRRTELKKSRSSSRHSQQRQEQFEFVEQCVSSPESWPRGTAGTGLSTACTPRQELHASFEMNQGYDSYSEYDSVQSESLGRRQDYVNGDDRDTLDLCNAGHGARQRQESSPSHASKNKTPIAVKAGWAKKQWERQEVRGTRHVRERYGFADNSDSEDDLFLTPRRSRTNEEHRTPCYSTPLNSGRDVCQQRQSRLALSPPGSAGKRAWGLHSEPGASRSLEGRLTFEQTPVLRETLMKIRQDLMDEEWDENDLVLKNHAASQLTKPRVRSNGRRDRIARNISLSGKPKQPSQTSDAGKGVELSQELRKTFESLGVGTEARQLESLGTNTEGNQFEKSECFQVGVQTEVPNVASKEDPPLKYGSWV